MPVAENVHIVHAVIITAAQPRRGIFMSGGCMMFRRLILLCLAAAVISIAERGLSAAEQGDRMIEKIRSGVKMADARFGRDIKDIYIETEINMSDGPQGKGFVEITKQYHKRQGSRTRLDLWMNGILCGSYVANGNEAWQLSLVPGGQKKRAPAGTCIYGNFVSTDIYSGGIRYIGTDTVSGKNAYVVEYYGNEGGQEASKGKTKYIMRFWIDQEEMTVLKQGYFGFSSEGNKEEHAHFVSVYSDFKPVEGFRYPYARTTTYYDHGTGKPCNNMIETVRSIAVNKGMSDDIFDPDAVLKEVQSSISGPACSAEERAGGDADEEAGRKDIRKEIGTSLFKSIIKSPF